MVHLHNFQLVQAKPIPTLGIKTITLKMARTKVITKATRKKTKMKSTRKKKKMMMTNLDRTWNTIILIILRMPPIKPPDNKKNFFEKNLIFVVMKMNQKCVKCWFWVVRKIVGINGILFPSFVFLQNQKNLPYGMQKALRYIFQEKVIKTSSISGPSLTICYSITTVFLNTNIVLQTFHRLNISNELLWLFPRFLQIITFFYLKFFHRFHLFFFLFFFSPLSLSPSLSLSMFLTERGQLYYIDDATISKKLTL